jgi:hypothetical protein
VPASDALLKICPMAQGRGRSDRFTDLVLKDLRKIPVIAPSAADLALEQLLGFIFWGNAEPVPKYRGR